MSQEEFVNRLKTANAKAVLIIKKDGRAVVKFYINRLTECYKFSNAFFARTFLNLLDIVDYKEEKE